MGVVVSKMWGWKELLNVLLLSFVIAVVSLGQYVDAGPPRRAPEKIQVLIDDSVIPAQKENQIQNEPYTEPDSEPEPYAEPHSEPEPYAELLQNQNLMLSHTQNQKLSLQDLMLSHTQNQKQNLMLSHTQNQKLSLQNLMLSHL